jgi:arylsulfatase A-like enzyme
LVFVVDQMQSYCLGCNGNNEVKTPNIDRIAAQGTTFLRAYCNNPVCMPSRSTMITGLTPRQHGCITNGTKLPENIPTITAALVNHGYRTHSAGKLHLQPTATVTASDCDGEMAFSWETRTDWNKRVIKSLPEMYYGFQTSDFVGGHVKNCFGDYLNWLGENHPDIYEKYQPENAYYKKAGAPSSWRMDMPAELHYNNWIADRSIQFISEIKEEENFFLWCSFPDPHIPFAACKPYSDMYNPEEVSLNASWSNTTDSLDHLEKRRKQFKNHTEFDEAGLREIVAQTYGMITHIDHNVGRVMEELKAKGLDDNTVVVFMADHGEYLGAHHLLSKAEWPYEEMIRIPYIWKIPEAYNTGITNSDVVSLLDFAPTILDCAGISQDELDFRGMRKADKLGLPGRSLLGFLNKGEVLEGRPAIIEYDEDWHSGPFYRERIIVEGKYKMAVFPGVGGGMLFDLESDPHEMVNLYYDKDYKEIKAELMENLLFELAKTDRLDQPRICGA